MTTADTFIANALTALRNTGDTFIAKLQGDQLPIVEKATKDVAYQTYLALTGGPTNAPIHRDEARFGLSTLASEGALAALRAEKSVGEAVATAGAILVRGLLGLAQAAAPELAPIIGAVGDGLLAAWQNAGNSAYKAAIESGKTPEEAGAIAREEAAKVPGSPYTQRQTPDSTIGDKAAPVDSTTPPAAAPAETDTPASP